MIELNHLTNLRVISSYRAYSSAGTAVKKESREHWAIVLKIGGKTVYRVGGATAVSDANHPVILPKGLSYEWKCLEAGEFLLIEFDAAETDTELHSFTVADPSELVRQFCRIERGTATHPHTKGLSDLRCLCGMLIFLLESGEEFYLSKQSREALLPAVTFLAEQYADGSITNDKLAALCGISTVYFRKLFRAAYGVSPMQYLQNIRIEKAKEMLGGDYSGIGDVGKSVGYHSIYHFSKMFREITGMAPSEYGKQGKKSRKTDR